MKATSSIRISHLVLDFDETLTTFDTISALAATAYNSLPLRESVSPWTHFTDAYLHDYREHMNKLPPSSIRMNVTEEMSFLSSLLPPERASIERIEAAGVFKGLRPSDIAKSAREAVSLREGVWQHLLKPALENGTRISVLSVNWSAVWILEGLKEGIRKENGNAEDLAIDVICNDLETDGTGTLTGVMTRPSGSDEGIWTAVHKRAAFNAYVDRDSNHGTAVYVGDSPTDLGALLAADIGIVIGNKLDSVCSRIGIELVSGTSLQEMTGHEQSRILKVMDVMELGHFLWPPATTAWRQNP